MHLHSFGMRGMECHFIRKFPLKFHVAHIPRDQPKYTCAKCESGRVLHTLSFFPAAAAAAAVATVAVIMIIGVGCWSTKTANRIPSLVTQPFQLARLCIGTNGFSFILLFVFASLL